MVGEALTSVGRTVGWSDFTVARCRTDFELVELVPLFIGAIPLGDGLKFADPPTRIKYLRFIHFDIMNYTASSVQHLQ